MLGAVAGLVTSGIQRVRQAAQQISCGNNLKQLGLGVSVYCDTHGNPPSLVDHGENSTTGDGLVSVFGTITRYLEASSFQYHKGSPPANYHAHSSVAFSYRGKDGQSRVDYGGDANQFYWRAFVCPSDTTATRLRDVPMTLPNGSVGHYATGSYAANGMFPWGIERDAKSPLEGLSQTILIAERPQVCRTADGDTIYNLWGLGFYSPHMPAFAALAPVGSPEAWTTGQIAPDFPVNEEPILVRIGRAEAPPQAIDLGNAFPKIAADRPCDPRLPGSPHRTGMQAAMGNGSVRFYSYDTTPAVFWAACRADERPVSPTR